MMELCYIEKQEIPSVNSEFLFSWFRDVCSREEKELGDVTVIFCSDDYLLKMNQDYLNHDYYTDIITFDYSDGNLVSGDLFISLDTVESNAVLFEVDFVHELYRVCVHGVLHLCGYKDKLELDEKQMRDKEEEMLQLVMFHVEHLRDV
jgi:probable rRNA maturation factor